MAWTGRLTLLVAAAGAAYFVAIAVREGDYAPPPLPGPDARPVAPLNVPAGGSLSIEPPPPAAPVTVPVIPAPDGPDPLLAEGLKTAWDRFSQGDFNTAMPLFEAAVQGGLPTASYGLAMTYQRLERPGDALLMAHQATAEAPDQAPVWRLLGQLQKDGDDLAGAVDSWERAERLEPDPTMGRLLERARQDLVTQQTFFVGETRHFRIRFEGPAESYVAERVLDHLEAAYAAVGLSLGYYPDEVIEAVLYTEQQFFDVTRSPAWARGIYDGKVRLPISGADQDPRKLERVVHHEYVHAAVQTQLPRVTLPTWLHEGLAMNLEGTELDRWARTLWTESAPRPSLARLSRPFLKLSQDEADLAYAQSYVFVKSLFDRFGAYRVADFLRALERGTFARVFLEAFGEKPEQALERATRDFLS